MDNNSIQRKFKVYTNRQLDEIKQIARLPEEMRFAMEVVSKVLPFRVNEYVIEELIDWDNIPEDPIFQLTFPQRDMLERNAFNRMAALIRSNASEDEIQAHAVEIRNRLNPHPAGQMNLNAVKLGNSELKGMQHKYRETVLFFPSQGQLCHSFCTFCFRWAQFVGEKRLKIASNEAESLFSYLRRHREVSDLLLTGGDPMVMKSSLLRKYIEPLKYPEYEHIRNIRIGTKSLTFWPYRFISDSDSEDVLRLLEEMIAAGKHIAVMAHFNHWREMHTRGCREAIRRIRNTGAEIRCQAPLVAHINDDPNVWSRMWREQVALGMVPYYMFVERDTGAHGYFEVPLYRVWEIYRDAIKHVSGLARTARGPSMSCGPGKIEIQGVTEIAGEKVFALRFIQGRNPDWVQRPFFAKFDKEAHWATQLQPAFGEKEFFFEDEYRRMCSQENLPHIGRHRRFAGYASERSHLKSKAGQHADPAQWEQLNQESSFHSESTANTPWDS